MKTDPLKPVRWVGSSLKDLKEFPEEVRYHIGHALYVVQQGLKHQDAKPLIGLGSGVLEVVSDFDGNTFRAVYTVRFAEAVYVLHTFQKKAKRGIDTPKREIELVRERLRVAEEHYRRNHGNQVTR
jgi:phage-related protein